jgi:phosphoribosyl 1,2-cyclic phosphate phosphodiesterase
MKLTILGAGGATSIPRPLCFCGICEQARAEGIPYARTGPSLYIKHGGGILFDTPEEIRQQIEREHIKSLKHIFYTHWHPDHTQGMRIIEAIKHRRGKTKQTRIKVYIPTNAMNDFRQYCGYLWYYEKCGYCSIIEIDDRGPVEIDGLFVTPIDFQRHDRVRYGYRIDNSCKSAMYAPCSVFGAKIDHHWKELDYLVIESGWSGQTNVVRAANPKSMHSDHVSLEENIQMALTLRPKQTILTHVDGCHHLDMGGDYDLLCRHVAAVNDAKINIAYDGMQIEI